MSERRGMGLKIAVAVIGVLALLAGGTAVWVHTAASARMAEVEKVLAGLAGEAAGRKTDRPPRGGAGSPGNAWTDYEMAAAALPQDWKSVQPIDEFYKGLGKVGRAQVEPVILAHESAFRFLRQGVRRDHASLDPQWERGWDTPLIGPPMRVPFLIEVAVVRARLLAADGKGAEAAELLLDAAHACGDMGRNSIVIVTNSAVTAAMPVVAELRNLVVSGKLSNEDLVAVARELEAIDAALPRTGDALMNEVLCFGYDCLRQGGMPRLPGSGEEGIRRDWRHLWSARLYAADAFRRLLSARRMLAGIDAMTWAEAGRTWGRIEQSLDPNLPMDVAIYGVNALAFERGNRALRARMRLVRAAATWKAGGKAPDLGDPFGTKLYHQGDAGRLKVWSVGPDGADDGGSGDWTNYGKDIVLEVDR